MQNAVSKHAFFTTLCTHTRICLVLMSISAVCGIQQVGYCVTTESASTLVLSTPIGVSSEHLIMRQTQENNIRSKHVETMMK